MQTFLHEKIIDSVKISLLASADFVLFCTCCLKDFIFNISRVGVGRSKPYITLCM